jgi:hypothetical protein
VALAVAPGCVDLPATRLLLQVEVTGIAARPGNTVGNVDALLASTVAMGVASVKHVISAGFKNCYW